MTFNSMCWFSNAKRRQMTLSLIIHSEYRTDSRKGLNELADIMSKLINSEFCPDH